MYRHVYVRGLVVAMVVGMLIGGASILLLTPKTMDVPLSRYGICGDVESEAIQAHALDIDTLGALVADRTNQTGLKFTDVDLWGDCLIVTYITEQKLRWTYVLLTASNERWLLQDIWVIDVEPQDEDWPIVEEDSL